jgi:replication-associated recombination protein RarA
MAEEKKKPFQLTARGYDMKEVVSALQKECRRGNTRDALYWAYCLLPNYEDYLWRRLMVIAMEDVGMGDPDALVRLRACRGTWYEMRSWKGDSYHLVIAQAVQVLCSALKSRTNDYLQCVVRAELDSGQEKPIPDYALDMHTRRGRAMGRGTAHFRDHGAVLSPRKHEKDEWEDEAREKWDAGFPKPEKWGWKQRGAKAEAEAEKVGEPPDYKGDHPSLFG